MPLNMPTVTRDDISFGPALLFAGVAGATPTVDLGAIGEDGVTVEIATEQRDIMQGNPKLIEFTFNQSQSVRLKVTSIEWNMTNFANGLGSGVITTSGTFERFAFGGDPCPTELALQVQHQMCRTGDTINVNVWRAVGEGNTTLPFTHDEHQFEYGWKALRAETDWASAALGSESQLIQIARAM